MTIVNSDNQMPEGLGFRLALDSKAMTNYVNLSKDSKQQMIDYIKGSTSGQEAKNRVTEMMNKLHDGDSFR